MRRWVTVLAIAPLLSFVALSPATAAVGDTTSTTKVAPSNAAVIAACQVCDTTLAQGLVLDRALVTVPPACSTAIAAYKQALVGAGFTPKEVDAQWVALVVVLATGVEKLPLCGQKVVAAAVTEISKSVSNPSQATAVADIGKTIDSGQTLLTSSIKQLVSPN